MSKRKTKNPLKTLSRLIFGLATVVYFIAAFLFFFAIDSIKEVRDDELITISSPFEGIKEIRYGAGRFGGKSYTLITLADGQKVSLSADYDQAFKYELFIANVQKGDMLYMRVKKDDYKQDEKPDIYEIKSEEDTFLTLEQVNYYNHKHAEVSFWLVPLFIIIGTTLLILALYIIRIDHGTQNTREVHLR